MQIATSRFPKADVEVTRLGLGSAPLGGMYRSVSTADALATLRAAWEVGIRYVDTAPMYGLGRSEHLVGTVLREVEEQSGGTDWVIETKVGRLIRNPRPGAPLPPAAPKNEFDSGWHSGLRFTEVFDYSYDGVMRSYEDSQQRLGLDRIDILLVHDIGRATHGTRHEKHWTDLTKGGGFRALGELRSGGYIKAVGLGVNETQAVREALDEFDIDCCLLAGRYTLLDQSAATELFPLCVERKVAVIAAGVFNSGILVSDDRKFNYVDAPAEIVAKAERLKAICRDFSVPLPAAALQFPQHHSAVATVVVGARAEAEVRQAAEWFGHKIPAAFWTALRDSGLIIPQAPLPDNA